MPNKECGVGVGDSEGLWPLDDRFKLVAKFQNGDPDKLPLRLLVSSPAAAGEVLITSKSSMLPLYAGEGNQPSWWWW